MNRTEKETLRGIMYEMVGASDWVVQFNRRMDAVAFIEEKSYELGEEKTKWAKKEIDKLYRKHLQSM